MGDRRSIEVINSKNPDFKSQWFYTHWNGPSMAKTLAKSLTENRDWWSETPNLNAVVASAPFRAIGADLSDLGTYSDYYDLIVDVGAGTVQEEGDPDPYVTDTVLTYDEFCADPDQLPG